jgi:hypothetical protein
MLQNLNAPKSVASQREMDMFHSSATARKRSNMTSFIEVVIRPIFTSVTKEPKE